MAAFMKTAGHPSGKLLRTGDLITVYGYACEFVGKYAGIIIYYNPVWKTIGSADNWDHINVYDPPDMEMQTRDMEPLFDVELPKTYSNKLMQNPDFEPQKIEGFCDIEIPDKIYGVMI